MRIFFSILLEESLIISKWLFNRLTKVTNLFFTICFNLFAAHKLTLTIFFCSFFLGSWVNFYGNIGKTLLSLVRKIQSLKSSFLCFVFLITDQTYLSAGHDIFRSYFHVSTLCVVPSEETLKMS